METKYIKSVLAVAEYLNFSRAAEAIPCSQSSISRQVKTIEDELGAELFVRSFNAGKVELTPYGTQAIPVLREIYERCLAVLKMADQPVDIKKITYRVGVCRGPFNAFAKANLVSEIFVKHPEINIVIKEVPLDGIMECLSRGEVDAAIYYKAHFKNAEKESVKQSLWLREKKLFNKIPCIAMPKDHPLAGCEAIDFAELKEETFLLHHDIAEKKDSKHDVGVQGFMYACLNADFFPKTEVLPLDTIADIRDAAVLAYGWMYPSFATKIMRNNDKISFVPIKDAAFYATYYMVATNKEPEITKMVMRDIKNILIRDDKDVF